jgi:hypothetical protein
MERIRMKKTIAIAALALSLVPSATMAQERGGDAALGALSGAVVLGPVGAVAGAIVGYTAGPSIARSWGFRRSGAVRRERRSAQQAQQETRVSRADAQPAPRNQATAPAATQAPPPAKTVSSAPPVQGLE